MLRAKHTGINRQLYNRLRRITTSGIYMPEVDGIRFISILWVVLMHVYGYYFPGKSMGMSAPGHDSIFAKIMANGGGGVSLFFVLSGFILALPFARHYIYQERPVVLRSYYIRRFTRIEPPYMLAMLLCFAGYIYINPRSSGAAFQSLLTSLLYVHNIFGKNLPALNSPAWSLELEIQFYIIAPFLFYVFRFQKLLRRLLIITVMSAVIIIRYFYPHHFFSLYSCFEFFLAGILLADFYLSGIDIAGNTKTAWSVISVLSLMFIVFQPFSYNYFLHYFTFPFVIIIFFYTILRHPFIRSLFSYKWIPVIGGMCYSIYLLHYPVISFLGRYTRRIRSDYLSTAGLLLQLILLGSAIFLTSAVYYYFVERRFMRLGKKSVSEVAESEARKSS